MSSAANKTKGEASLSLNLFCTRHEDGNWRIHAAPGWMPRHLRACFDDDWQIFPALLDFDELDRTVREKELQIEMRWSTEGGVELTAHGRSAEELGLWILRMLASGIRQTAPGADVSTG
jgi:hypothetical protein